MPEQQSPEVPSYESTLRVRDIEENQKLMRERLLLISQNFIETQKKNQIDLLEIKKQMEAFKSDIERLKNTISTISDEVSKSARKEDIAILSRQFKMFEPLEFARIQDIENIIDEKLNKHKTHSEIHTESQKETPHSFWAGKL